MSRIFWNHSTVLNSTAQTITNTVNCVGVMGAGLALEFRLRYPEMFREYLKKCKRREISVGKPWLFINSNYDKWIYNFPTKNHWKRPSKVEWIIEGLEDFVKNYQSLGITSIAFPKLGSNLGGLDWEEVKKVMEHYLKKVDIPVEICLDEEVNATGLELKMLDIFLSYPFDENPDLKEVRGKLVQREPLTRFYKLKTIGRLSANQYEKAFRICYNLAINE